MGGGVTAASGEGAAPPAHRTPPNQPTTELPELERAHGEGEAALSLIHNQLALWRFYGADYPAALASARTAYQLMSTSAGSGSTAEGFYGVRLGIVLQGAPCRERRECHVCAVHSLVTHTPHRLAASGDSHAAYPLLSAGMEAAVPEHNLQVDAVRALPQDAPNEERAAAMGRLALLALTVAEARFHRGLAALRHAAPALEKEWEAQGRGALLVLGQELGESLRELLDWVPADAADVRCALREHQR